MGQFTRRSKLPKRSAAWSGLAIVRGTTTRRGRYIAQTGQNLVELAMTLPFVLVFIFFIIDSGRAWMAYEGAKMAAREGAYVAAIYHNPRAGQMQLDYKLSLASLKKKSAIVKQVPGQHAYQSDVTVTFESLFGSLQIPTLSGPIHLLPAQFDISYTAVTDVAVY